MAPKIILAIGGLDKNWRSPTLLILHLHALHKAFVLKTTKHQSRKIHKKLENSESWQGHEKIA
jgi:hypothetical protein